MTNEQASSSNSNAATGGWSRRRFLQTVVGVGAGAGVVAAGFRLLPDGGGAPAPPTTTASDTTAPAETTTSVTTRRNSTTTATTSPQPPDFTLSDFADNIRSGGPPKDGIPPIDEPVYIATSEVDFLEEDDVVFGLSRGGTTRAYPQLILVWHEIVNDQFPDGPVSVTYCPLTGSTVGFKGVSPTGEPLTFGTSGNLVNSNLLMYDRPTNSNWPQILGTAIKGSAEGSTLEEIPMVWTTWGRWQELFPESEVLSTETGHIRSYGSDPYGAYNPLGGYYQPDSTLIFPTMWADDRFPAKEVFIGAKQGKARLAVRKSTLRERQVMATTIDTDPVVVLYDPALDAGRVFRARDRKRRLELVPGAESGTFEDRSRGRVWDASGRPLGDGALLQAISNYDAMWFSWVAFFPHTDVVA